MIQKSAAMVDIEPFEGEGSYDESSISTIVWLEQVCVYMNPVWLMKTRS